MPISTFNYGPLTIEVTLPTGVDMQAFLQDAVDVHATGARWAFQGGRVVIDLSQRIVREKPGATLVYRLLRGRQEVIAMRGVGSRRACQGGNKVAPRTYRF